MHAAIMVTAEAPAAAAEMESRHTKKGFASHHTEHCLLITTK
jgi:hypothetical protein